MTNEEAEHGAAALALALRLEELLDGEPQAVIAMAIAIVLGEVIASQPDDGADDARIAVIVRQIDEIVKALRNHSEVDLANLDLAGQLRALPSTGRTH